MDRRMGKEDIFREAVENLATIIKAAELPENERLKSALQKMHLNGRPFIERKSHDDVLKTALDHAYTLFRNGVKDGTQYTIVVGGPKGVGKSLLLRSAAVATAVGSALGFAGSGTPGRTRVIAAYYSRPPVYSRPSGGKVWLPNDLVRFALMKHGHLDPEHPVAQCEGGDQWTEGIGGRSQGLYQWMRDNHLAVMLFIDEYDLLYQQHHEQVRVFREQLVNLNDDVAPILFWLSGSGAKTRLLVHGEAGETNPNLPGLTRATSNSLNAEKFRPMHLRNTLSVDECKRMILFARPKSDRPPEWGPFLAAIEVSLGLRSGRYPDEWPEGRVQAVVQLLYWNSCGIARHFERVEQFDEGGRFIGRVMRVLKSREPRKWQEQLALHALARLAERHVDGEMLRAENVFDFENSMFLRDVATVEEEMNE